MVKIRATNFVAHLEKYTANNEYHSMIEYLCHSLIHFAITCVPKMYRETIVPFWKLVVVTDEGTITTTVLGKEINIDA